MARVVARRPVMHWILTLFVGMVVGVLFIGRADASGPPGGLETTQQNVDTEGNIRVHEQGIADVRVTNSALTADVAVPATRTVDGTVSSEQSEPWSVGIAGTPTVNVGSLPPAPTPQFGTVLLITQGGAFETATTPSNVIITYVFGSVREFGDEQATPGCKFEIIKDGTKLWYQEFGDNARSPLFLNLTTGIQGPLAFRVYNNVHDGHACRVELTWTGVPTP